MNENTPYWMALAHAENFFTRRKMEFLIHSVYEKEPLPEVMKKIRAGDRKMFDFSDKEWAGIRKAAEEIPNYCFLAEKLDDQGIKIIPVMDEQYPKLLKENLKKTAPVVLYAKGNTDLLKKKSIAIVGSRKSAKISLDFTDTLAGRYVKEDYVVVSGFAKGVDRQALDSALKHQGESIIVLPQGIDTYHSKTYYPEIIRGNVLVISTYHPRTPWSTGLAMDRNRIIYALAEKIFVAESSDSGGTWEGVRQGLKQGRKIYVRKAGSGEKNANNRMIAMGAIPVDLQGNEIKNEVPDQATLSEPQQDYTSQEEPSDKVIIERTIEELKKEKGKGLTTKKLAGKLHLDEKTARKLKKILSGSNDILVKKQGRNNFFYLKKDHPQQTSLF